jgi:enamine deaminase RidA (YjgF/YER057c/UK114 family)
MLHYGQAVTVIGNGATSPNELILTEITEQIRQVMKQMNNVSEDELNEFLGLVITKIFKRQEQ